MSAEYTWRLVGELQETTLRGSTARQEFAPQLERLQRLLRVRAELEERKALLRTAHVALLMERSMYMKQIILIHELVTSAAAEHWAIFETEEEEEEEAEETTGGAAGDKRRREELEEDGGAAEEEKQEQGVETRSGSTGGGAAGAEGGGRGGADAVEHLFQVIRGILHGQAFSRYCVETALKRKVIQPQTLSPAQAHLQSQGTPSGRVGPERPTQNGAAPDLYPAPSPQHVGGYGHRQPQQPPPPQQRPQQHSHPSPYTPAPAL